MFDINQVNKNIGKNVKLLRTSQGLTQEELAEAVGLERKSITAIETGRTFISCEVLVNLSNHFNVEPAFFFRQNLLEYSDKTANLKNKIVALLAGHSEKELKKIFNIIITMFE